MKLVNLFWGSFFIFFGLLWINNYFNFIEISFSEYIGIWPILFVFIGLIILNFSKIINIIMTTASSLLVAIIVIGFFQEANDLNININLDNKCSPKIWYNP